MSKIVFTGGGSSGHVILNLNLIKYFQKEGWEIYYLGSFEGIENELLKDYPYVHYIGIPTGKLRRYYSLENFKDLFRILSGIKRAYTELRKIRPELIFSKGGFVSVPSIVAGKLLNIKSFIHESDITIGLANKIAYHFCDRMFTTFSLEGLKKSKRVGSVIDSSANCVDLPFIDNKPVLLITGGSLGAQTLNDFVEKNKNCLLEKFNVIHISGDKKAKIKTTNYWNIDYTKDGLTPFIKSADLIISRAGSNSIFEILNEKKLNILVPLPLSSSRGDQIKNAQYFQEKGYSYIISDDELTMRSFEAAKAYLDTNKDMIYDNLINSNETISTKKFFELIKKEL